VTSAPRVTVVGDTLLDVDWIGDVERVCPDAPVPVVEHRSEATRPGGAGLAAWFAARGGAEVTLVTALGDDAEGDVARAGLRQAGIALIDLGLDGPTPVKLRVRSGGQSLTRIDRGCTPVLRPGAWGDDASAAVIGAEAVLVSDYGRTLAATPAFGALLAGLDGVPVLWDPHRNGPVPPAGLDVLVPNRVEARALAGGGAPDDDPALAAALARRFGATVVLTCGARGALVAEPGRDPVPVAAAAVAGDPCGAGDCFAASLAAARARGVPVLAAAAAAVEDARRHVIDGFRPVGAGTRPSPLVVRASGGLFPAAGRPEDELPPRVRTAPELAAAVRAEGGTVVAAGGCFDVLHAGHVDLLARARRLGDCLIVCLNGDLSVRRLKGRHRPVNSLADRVAVLEALAAVDAVAVFDDDTPCALLEQLRPDVFVKGSDYAGDDLPERPVLARWGGEVVYLPVVPGRSTTRILQAATATAS
jgi:rfaE bifunctional protein nucleotidyltransferase chain/domain/rfaE bifunctional protein kinase chain/domain